MRKHLVALSLFLFSSASAQLIISPNVKVSNDYTYYLFDFWYPEEVSIAIDRAKPDHIVAGANMCYHFSSSDAGASWSVDTLVPTYGNWGDPSILSDELGNIYYAHLSGMYGQDNWLDRMVIQVSSDGGKTFSNGSFAGLNASKHQDKEWLSCDRTNSPYSGNLYISWTEFDNYGSNDPNDSSQILFARSTDQGATWTDPIRVNDKGGDCLDGSNTVEGATTAPGPNGELYIAWAGAKGIYFDRSFDGGKTFSADRMISTQKPGWAFAVSGLERCNGLPLMLCDVSSSPSRGNIYIVFNDKRNGAANGDVFLIRSSDGGDTWTEPKKVNDDTNLREQFFPSAAIDQTTGFLYTVFYDRRNHEGNDSTDVYLARSSDGGETFRNVKISDTAFLPTPDMFLGDYIHIDAHNKNIYAIWTRIDGQLSSVWATHIIDTAQVLGVAEHSKETASLGLYPNPANAFIRIQCADAKRIVITDALGREIHSFAPREQEITYNVHSLVNGIYYCTVENAIGRETRKFVVSH